MHSLLLLLRRRQSQERHRLDGNLRIQFVFPTILSSCWNRSIVAWGFFFAVNEDCRTKLVSRSIFDTSMIPTWLGRRWDRTERSRPFLQWLFACLVISSDWNWYHCWFLLDMHLVITHVDDSDNHLQLSVLRFFIVCHLTSCSHYHKRRKA